MPDKYPHEGPTPPYEGPWKKVLYTRSDAYGYDLYEGETAYFPEDYEIPFSHEIVETGVGKLRGCDCTYVCFGRPVDQDHDQALDGKSRVKLVLLKP